MTAQVLDAPIGDALPPPATAKPGPGLHIVLLLFALAIGVLAQVAVSLALHGSITGSIGASCFALVSNAAVGHTAVRLWAPYADPLICRSCWCSTASGWR